MYKILGVSLDTPIHYYYKEINLMNKIECNKKKHEIDYEEMFKLGYVIADTWKKINFESEELQNKWHDLIVDDLIQIAINIQKNKLDMWHVSSDVDEGCIYETSTINIIKDAIREYIESQNNL